MAASQLWYVPHRPDLLLLAPCDEEGPLPCPGSLFVSIDHLHPPERAEAKWRHPAATPFLTCFGELATQQPRLVRCACGHRPCKMRGLQERGGVPDELIPTDWAANYQPPPKDPANYGPEGRRGTVLQLYLECTGRADKELPPLGGGGGGEEHPSEERVKQAAEVMLTEYLKGRVCFQCNMPSSRMQKCARCQQARYCSKECQRAHWGAHKVECATAAAAAAPAVAAAASPPDSASSCGTAVPEQDGTQREPEQAAAGDAAAKPEATAEEVATVEAAAAAEVDSPAAAVGDGAEVAAAASGASS